MDNNKLVMISHFSFLNMRKDVCFCVKICLELGFGHIHENEIFFCTFLKYKFLYFFLFMKQIYILIESIPTKYVGSSCWTKMA